MINVKIDAESERGVKQSKSKNSSISSKKDDDNIFEPKGVEKVGYKNLLEIQSKENFT